MYVDKKTPSLPESHSINQKNDFQIGFDFLYRRIKFREIDS